MPNEPLPQVAIFGQRWLAELPLEVTNALTNETTGCYELYKKIIWNEENTQAKALNNIDDLRI